MADDFAQKLYEMVAQQMEAQKQQMQAALKAQDDRMNEFNQQLTQQLNPTLTGTPVCPGPSAEEWALLKLLRDNPQFREAVQALAKGWAATPAPAGGS